MRLPLEGAGPQISKIDLLARYISKNTAVVMYDFASQEDNELSLVRGQNIVVWREDQGKVI